MNGRRHTLTHARIRCYMTRLQELERAPQTIQKYARDIEALREYLAGEPVSKRAVHAWKEHLLAAGYAPVTINSMLAAVNGILRFLGWEECRVQFLKVQRRLFRDASRELTREEYERMVATARGQGRERLALLLETICATGIRVSEVRCITVESVRSGRAEVAMKGKIRTILIPGRLCRKLLKYAQGKKITSGEIFLTRSGCSLSRKQIWAEMKRLCEHAGVARSKGFPHNLRHLFALVFYRACKDIAQLADVLGHSSIETTRLYLVTSGAEHLRRMERLGIIL